MPTAIDLKNLSFAQILEDLESYVEGHAELGAWKDFYAAGAGQTFLELVAGLGAYLSAHSLVARRESYPDTARLRSSVIRLASIAGYPVNRPSAPKLSLQINNTGAPYVLDKATILGNYVNNLPLVITNTDTIPTGNSTIQVYVGTWQTTQLNQTVQFQKFYINDPGADNNLSRWILGTLDHPAETPVIHYAEKGDSGSVLIRTVNGGVLLIFGDGIIGASPLEPVDVEWVTSEGLLPVTDFVLADVQISLPNTSLVSGSILEYGSNADSTGKIATSLSGYFAAHRAMLSADDHIAILLAFSGSLVSASARKKTGVCCTVSMSYLFEDEHIATTNEKASMLEYMNPFKVAGETIELVDPIRVGLILTLTVVATPAAINNDIAQDIEDTVMARLLKLGVVFHVGEVVQDIASLEGVIGVYLQSPSSDKELDVNQYLGLDGINLTLTHDSASVKLLDPDNEGYSDGGGPPPPTTAAIPASPANLVLLTPTHESITVVWASNSNNEAGFKVERRLSSETDDLFTEVIVTAADVSLVVDDEGLLPLTQYCYRVRAYNSAGNSGYTNIVCISTMAAPEVPFDPSNLTAQVFPGQIVLDWEDNSNSESGFHVERKLTSEGSGAWITVQSVATDVESYTDTAIDYATSYDYRVRAFNGAGPSGFTNTLTAVSLGRLPSDPVNLQVVDNEGFRIIISWVPRSSNEAGFQVERQLTSAPGWDQIADLPAATSFFIDEQTSPDVSFEYRVRAYNGSGSSSWSNTVVVVGAPSVPEAPFGVGVGFVPGLVDSVEVSWNHDREDVSFRLQYRQVQVPSLDWTQDATVISQNTWSFIKTGLTGGASHEFRMVAVNSEGTSPASPSVTANASVAPLPTAPILTALTAIGGGEMIVDWSDESSDETGFLVQFRISAVSAEWIDFAPTAAANAVTQTVTGLLPTGTYDFRVIAFNANGWSDASNVETEVAT